MDSAAPETTGSPLPSDEPASGGSASRPHPDPRFGCGAVVGGALYMIVLFAAPGLAALAAGLSASHGDTSYGDPIGVFVSTAVVLVCFGCALLWPLFQRVGVPRPAVTLCFLTGVVGVVYVQLMVTFSLIGASTSLWPVGSALWAFALSGFAGLVALVWTQGREFRWAVAVVVAVVVLRALVDWNSHVQEEREAFDEVREKVSAHAGRALLLESREWSAVHAWDQQGEYLRLDYETSDGDRIEITTWADFVADALGDPAPADPLRDRCDFEGISCEETEEAGLTVMSVHDEDGSQGDLVRAEWSPGVYVELRSREGANAEDLRALLGALRTAEEEDAVALAEEITAGPRP
ncbi:hypothetical protein DFP74_5019 [Nocardiopsis sp. Huas11]|uniref:hypothetical protein n=1 Tax=Nocardiopsis sp. Huas11 TaxID=2183912 RepID=UPI000EACD2BC|nr:hypothetical protein [Nocardiopsis sp. Huas11]RKS09285.1 hypothetical protein DFP74_5019 [Nocardiopsis sp. Huas11]